MGDAGVLALAVIFQVWVVFAIGLGVVLLVGWAVLSAWWIGDR